MASVQAVQALLPGGAMNTDFMNTGNQLKSEIISGAGLTRGLILIESGVVLFHR
ncbi:MAG: hypothetical protein IPP46_18285 [Bacteroidetes bacterium]|nr:hypothetical protein [Bacteroidota bacterium]